MKTQKQIVESIIGMLYAANALESLMFEVDHLHKTEQAKIPQKTREQMNQFHDNLIHIKEAIESKFNSDEYFAYTDNASENIVSIIKNMVFLSDTNRDDLVKKVAYNVDKMLKIQEREAKKRQKQKRNKGGMI